MRTQQTGPLDWCGLEVVNDDGERYDQLDCPSLVKERITKALERGEQEGIVCHAGQLWRWRHVVVLEIEDHGRVIQRIPVPWTSWQAFRLLAARKGFRAKQWLAAHVAAGLGEGRSIRETVDLLFSTDAEWQDETETQALEESIA